MLLKDIDPLSAYIVGHGQIAYVIDDRPGWEDTYSPSQGVYAPRYYGKYQTQSGRMRARNMLWIVRERDGWNENQNVLGGPDFSHLFRPNYTVADWNERKEEPEGWRVSAIRSNRVHKEFDPYNPTADQEEVRARCMEVRHERILQNKRINDLLARVRANGGVISPGFDRRSLIFKVDDLEDFLDRHNIG